MQIKVCGMREFNNIKDLLYVVKPHFVGFIFYKKSERYVSESFYNELNYDNCKKTGVFVNETREVILEKINKYNLDIVQLHGSESVDDCAFFRQEGLTVFKAFSIDDNFNFEDASQYEKSCDMFVFDAKGYSYGGNGVKYNWDLLQNYKGNTPFLLSGGININDVDIVRSLKHEKFVGVDINSGFEIKPAFKDINLLKEFKERITQ